ncbi:MAG: tRNA lysidine(34) synthetase TilS [Dethiobacteria bacterium]
MVKDKVRKTIDRHKLFQPGDKVLTGVSGGPDSLCLLHILLQLRSELGIRIYVAHLDHGLRAEASREFEFVRALSGKWGLPFYGARVDTAFYRQKKGLSVQAAARFCRYIFFKKAAAYFGANKIATAHHHDDQVETILMNIINGTGLDGLAGIKVIRRHKGIELVRPLLETGKDEIIACCHENGLEPVCDLSNLEPVYLRNKIRLELIPYLAREYNPRIGEAVSRLSALAGEEGAYLHRKAFLLYKKYAREQGKDKVIIDAVMVQKLHTALRRRILRIAWQRINRDEDTVPESKHIEALEYLLHENRVGKEIQLPHHRRAYITAAGLVMATESRRKRFVMEAVVLNVPGITSVPDIKGIYETVIKDPRELSWPPDDRREAYLDYERLSLPLAVTCRWAGARFRPLGMDGRKKKLKDYLIDRKIPRQERDHLPLVVSGTDIAWVTGLGIAHPFRITTGTRRALVIRFKPDHKNRKDEEC